MRDGTYVHGGTALRLPLLLAFVSAAILLLAACAPAAAPSPTAAPAKPAASPAAKAPEPAAKAEKPAGKPSETAAAQALIAEARTKNETDLDLSWNARVLPAETAKGLGDLFNRMYGLNVKVNFTPGPALTESVQKATQEVAAGQKAFTDVLLSESFIFARPLDRVLEGYDYSQLSPRIAKELVAPQNLSVEIASRVPGISYNTNAISAAEAPRKLEDVLQDKWKGKTATTPGANDLNNFGSHPNWNAAKVTAFVTRLSDHAGGLLRCGEPERIATGEFIMLVTECGSYNPNRAKAQGAPLGFSIPEDAASVAFYYMGVPRTAPHPNLAKLFINTMMSEEGQKIIFETTLIDHYALPGSRSVAELTDLRSKGFPVLRVDAKFTAEHPENEELRLELTKILRERHGG